MPNAITYPNFPQKISVVFSFYSLLPMGAYVFSNETVYFLYREYCILVKRRLFECKNLCFFVKRSILKKIRNCFSVKQHFFETESICFTYLQGTVGPGGRCFSDLLLFLLCKTTVERFAILFRSCLKPRERIRAVARANETISKIILEL